MIIDEGFSGTNARNPNKKLPSSRKGIFLFILKKWGELQVWLVPCTRGSVFPSLGSALAPFLGKEFLSGAVRGPPAAGTPCELFASPTPALLGILFPESLSKTSQNCLSLNGVGQVPTRKPTTVTWKDGTHLWSQGEKSMRLGPRN